MGQQFLQHGQRKRRGLARARLRTRHQVMAFQHHWDGLRLDRGGYGVTGFGECPEDFGRQLQIGKTNGVQYIVLFVLFGVLIDTLYAPAPIPAGAAVKPYNRLP